MSFRIHLARTRCLPWTETSLDNRQWPTLNIAYILAEHAPVRVDNLTQQRNTLLFVAFCRFK